MAITAPTKISELNQVVPQLADQLLIARGSGSSGVSLKITVGSLLNDQEIKIDTITNDTINVTDTPTVDLTYNPATRNLKADLQQTLDLRTRTVMLPCNVEVPPGCIMPFAGKTAPCGWLICNGDIVPAGVNIVQGKTADFSRLKAVVGTTYGVDGQLPDLRGIFVRGYGGTNPAIGANNDGTQSGPFGQTQEDAFQGHKHQLHDPGHIHAIIDPGHAHNVTDSGHIHTGRTSFMENLGSGGTGAINVNWNGSGYEPGSSTGTGGEWKDNNHDHSIVLNSAISNLTIDSAVTNITATVIKTTETQVGNPTIDTASGGNGSAGPSSVEAPRTADETRPKNIALLYCIKY